VKNSSTRQTAPLHDLFRQEHFAISEAFKKRCRVRFCIILHFSVSFISLFAQPNVQLLYALSTIKDLIYDFRCFFKPSSVNSGLLSPLIFNLFKFCCFLP
jgi:hypothetical protein